MKISEFQKQYKKKLKASKTKELFSNKINFNLAMLDLANSTAGEAGELSNVVKKWFRMYELHIDKPGYDKVNMECIQEELVDVIKNAFQLGILLNIDIEKELKKEL